MARYVPFNRRAAYPYMVYKMWRALTTFFYFGPISLDFVFHLFFLYGGFFVALEDL
jgi:hypothetical protein